MNRQAIGWGASLLIVAFLAYSIGKYGPPQFVVTPAVVAPLSDPGFRVLITHRPDKASLPKGQASIIESADIRILLDSKCPPNGWHIWPSNTKVEADQPEWQRAMALVKDPDWLIVSNPGKGGFSGKLPATEAEVLAILKRYAP